MADGIWSVLIHSAGGGVSSLPWGYLGAAVLGTPGWTRSPSLHGGTKCLSGASAH